MDFRLSLKIEKIAKVESKNGIVLYCQLEKISKISLFSEIFGLKVKKEMQKFDNYPLFEILFVFDHIWLTSDPRASIFGPVLLYSVLK